MESFSVNLRNSSPHEVRNHQLLRPPTSVEVFEWSHVDSVLLAALEQFQDQDTNRLLLSSLDGYEDSDTTQ